MSIRLSVTDIDNYLYWRESEDMDLPALLQRLRHEEPPGEPMLRGRAFHSAMEAVPEGEWKTLAADDYQFSIATDAVIAAPAIRELKTEHVIQTDVGLVTLVGKVDALDGTTVHDYKLTERFDADRYAESYQWRAYLVMFGCQRFVYDVFVGKELHPRDIVIYDYQRFPLWAYPGMARDVTRVVGEIAAIIAKHIPERVTPDEVAA